MKNFLCATGIFLLIVMIAIPPVLRMVLPAKEEEKEEEKLIRKTLSCNSSVFLSATSYENDVVKMIVIKKTFPNTNLDTDTENETDTETTEETLPETVPDTESTDFENSELARIFDELKGDSRVVFEKVEDGEVLKIDFTVSDYSGLDIENLNKPINTQLTYYENSGLVCSILE